MTRAYIPDLTHVNIPSGSRYRRVEPGRLPYPYKCTGCGSTERACVDLDFQLTDDRIPRDRIGAVLLCVLCFRNVADVMGYAPVEIAKVDPDLERKVSAFGKLNASILSELRDKVEYFDTMVNHILAGNLDTLSDAEVEVDLESEITSGQDQPEPEQAGTRTGKGSEFASPEDILKEFGIDQPVSYESDGQSSESPSI